MSCHHKVWLLSLSISSVQKVVNRIFCSVINRLHCGNLLYSDVLEIIQTFRQDFNRVKKATVVDDLSMRFFAAHF